MRAAGGEISTALLSGYVPGTRSILLATGGKMARRSLEPFPAGRARTGRTPFVSQPSAQQPVRERSRRTQRPRVTNPQAPAVDLNKLPVRARPRARAPGVPMPRRRRGAAVPEAIKACDDEAVSN